MKQWTILIISVILLIFAGIWEINYLEKTSRYTLSDIEYVKNAVNNDNFDMAKKGIDNINDTWNSVKVVWHIFVDSIEIDGVEETIVALKSYAELGDKDEVIVKANELDRTINYIIKKQQVKIGNVF